MKILHVSNFLGVILDGSPAFVFRMLNFEILD